MVLVPACEPIRFQPLVGWRIIAQPSALDAAAWPAGSTVVRISPDDAFVIGGDQPVIAADEHSIVTPEHGFAGASLSAAQTQDLATHHIEWLLPAARPALAQGQIAGVPAKLVLHADGSAQLLVACAARAELEDRIA